MPDQHPNSEIPAQHSPFEHPLTHFSDRFNHGGPVKIVAIGSSSTAGEGGIAPYPCRLERALRDPWSWPENGEGARDLSAISKTNQMSTIRMYCDSHPLLNYFLGVGEAYRSLPKTPSPKG
jgi:hypothetical protein